MRKRIATIARYTMLEAMRTRFAAIALVIIGCALAASFFVGEIAVIERARFQTAFYAASIRFAAVFVVALYAIASVGREFQDKGLDVTLALDVPRSHYVLGKLAGFLAIGGGLAVACAVPLAASAGLEPAVQWAGSLACEIAIVVTLSLFCAITFNTLLPAASGVMAFYVLARALSAIRLMSAHPLSGAEELSHRFMSSTAEALALIVPALDRWTQTSWLVDGAAAWSAIAMLAAQSVVFVAVLAAAAVFDMHRRNL
jgi:ABC-type transport system involved in multi-copper enzyme maturation permease subunit